MLRCPAGRAAGGSGSQGEAPFVPLRFQELVRSIFAFVTTYVACVQG